MTKADSVHSTPPLNTSSRRKFLTQAAAVAAGGATLGAALPLPVPAKAAERVSDPIYAAIEAHKSARAALLAELARHSALDRELPIEKSRSLITAWNETIVATDDPRWIECERAVHHWHEAETDAACVLVSILPTTMAGVVALLRYTVDADTDGEAWPLAVDSDDGQTRSWRHFLIANLAEILPELASVTA